MSELTTLNPQGIFNGADDVNTKYALLAKHLNAEIAKGYDGFFYDSQGFCIATSEDKNYNIHIRNVIQELVKLTSQSKEPRILIDIVETDGDSQEKRRAIEQIISQLEKSIYSGNEELQKHRRLLDENFKLLYMDAEEDNKYMDRENYHYYHKHSLGFPYSGLAEVLVRLDSKLQIPYHPIFILDTDYNKFKRHMAGIAWGMKKGWNSYRQMPHSIVCKDEFIKKLTDEYIEVYRVAMQYMPKNVIRLGLKN